MEVVLYFFRDKIVGVHYFIYAFICLFFMFSIIGYLFKQKYAKLEIKLNTSQPKKEKKKKVDKNIKPIINTTNNQVENNKPVNLQANQGVNAQNVSIQSNQVVRQVTPQNTVQASQIPEIK